MPRRAAAASTGRFTLRMDRIDLLLIAHLVRNDALQNVVQNNTRIDRLLKVGLSDRFLGWEAQRYLEVLEERGLLTLQFHVELVDEPVAVDDGGPFQLWLRKLAEEVFSPLSGLFLPASDGMIRINPIPLAGCECDWLKQRCKPGVVGDIKQHYRFAGRLLGLALRPWRTSLGVVREQRFCLGGAVRLVPSLCKYLLEGDDYVPLLDDLR